MVFLMVILCWKGASRGKNDQMTSPLATSTTWPVMVSEWGEPNGECLFFCLLDWHMTQGYHQHTAGDMWLKLNALRLLIVHFFCYICHNPSNRYYYLRAVLNAGHAPFSWGHGSRTQIPFEWPTRRYGQVKKSYRRLRPGSHSRVGHNSWRFNSSIQYKNYIV